MSVLIVMNNVHTFQKRNQESTSPTVSTEAVAIIDAWENRNVLVMDVPAVFMQATMDDLAHVMLHGKMVDKLLEIDHDLYSP